MSEAYLCSVVVAQALGIRGQWRMGACDLLRMRRWLLVSR